MNSGSSFSKPSFVVEMDAKVYGALKVDNPSYASFVCKAPLDRVGLAARPVATVESIRKHIREAMSNKTSWPTKRYALMVELIAGPLVGGAHMDKRNAKNWGNLVIAINPAMLGDAATFYRSAGEVLERVHKLEAHLNNLRAFRTEAAGDKAVHRDVLDLTSYVAHVNSLLAMA